MGGSRIYNARNALYDLVSKLPDHVYFEVLCFGSYWRGLFGGTPR